jgi:ABC-type multidrug transport system fused ATPase/permease subunit
VVAQDPQEPTNPPIGWAQTAKFPPGWSDPDHRPGFRLRVASFVLLVIAVLLSVFGNWIVSEPTEDSGTLARTSQADAVLGLAVLLFFVAAVLMVSALVVSRRSRRTPTNR